MTSDSKRQITAQEVTINTVSIEIKTLTLGKKQMTLAVFRQLEERSIRDVVTADLRGQPWGRVNYHPDCNDEGRDHLHVVWQQDDKIYRSRVIKEIQYAPRFKELLDVIDEAFQPYIIARTLEGWIPPDWKDDGGGVHYLDMTVNNFQRRIRVDDYFNLPTIWKGEPDPTETYQYSYRNITFEQYQVERREALQKSRAAVSTKIGNRSSKAIQDTELGPAIAAYRAYSATWKRTWEEMATLDQLFIAV